MKIETLKERIEKAELKISKKQNTITKKQKSIEKKSNYLMTKYGVDYNTFDKYNREGHGWTREEDHDVYWTMCDIDTLIDDIKRLNKEIPEIQKTLEKYQGQLAGEIEKESIFIKEVPEVMKKLEEQLVLDLYRRVKEVTGEVTDWSYIRLEQGNEFPVLTGIVTGKEGKASVETILAGGYNIQRLHIRTLVRSF